MCLGVCFWRLERTGWERGLVGPRDRSAGRGNAVRRGHRPHRLRLAGPQKTVPERNLQPAEVGAAGSKAGAGLHNEASKRGEIDLVTPHDQSYPIAFTVTRFSTKICTCSRYHIGIMNRLRLVCHHACYIIHTVTKNILTIEFSARI